MSASRAACRSVGSSSPCGSLLAPGVGASAGMAPVLDEQQDDENHLQRQQPADHVLQLVDGAHSIA
jgi:hypothetical protein